MSDSNNPDGWTFSTFYAHFNERFVAAKDAISKVETATEKRFESVNEFRNTLRDQAAHFADKEQTERRLNTIETTLAASAGKSQGVGMSAGVIVQVLTSTAAAAAIIGAVLLTRH